MVYQRLTFILFLIFSLLLVSIQEISIVKAEGTILIRADGSIEGTDKIQRDGNSYTLTGNIYDKIFTEKANIVINGEDHVLWGTGTGIGFYVYNVNNVTIKNITIRNFEYGIHLDNQSSNNTISGTTLTGNNCGLYVDGSPNNIIIGNHIAYNIDYGFRFSGSNNILKNNTIYNNRCNFGIVSSSENNDIDGSNTINGKPIYYWFDVQNKTVPSDAGYVALVNCNNITIQNLNLANNWQGIMLIYTKNSKITQNIIRNNEVGISLRKSSSNNSITENFITNNYEDGIQLSESTNVYIAKNHITNNQNGLELFNAQDQNIISGNNITENNFGIYLQVRSDNNTIVGNNIANNNIGLVISGTSVPPTNRVYHNNFIYNVINLSPPDEVWSLGSNAAIFDNGNEGNYWDRYSGTDNNGDGVIDTPFNIDPNNIDNYPLISPTLLSALKIAPAIADGIIYIRADGLIEGTDKLQRIGNVYTLTDNIKASIRVEKDDIVVDGAGYIIEGIGSGTGIDLTYRKNVTISNIEIREFEVGIYLQSSSNNSISGSTLTANSWWGIFIYRDSNNNTISGNFLTNNVNGISLDNSNHNRIIRNTLMNNENGISFIVSNNNSIYDNNFINNTKQVFDIIWENPGVPWDLSMNIWNNSTTGNYWNDYTGIDNNGDGIGDTPQIIGENNQDNYPLMEPIEIPEFPSWTPLLVLSVAVVAVTVVYKRKLRI